MEKIVVLTYLDVKNVFDHPESEMDNWDEISKHWVSEFNEDGNDCILHLNPNTLLIRHSEVGIYVLRQLEKIGVQPARDYDRVRATVNTVRFMFKSLEAFTAAKLVLA